MLYTDGGYAITAAVQDAVKGANAMMSMPQVIESRFLGREGRPVQLWAVYLGPRLFSLTFAAAPSWISERIEFTVSRHTA